MWANDEAFGADAYFASDVTPDGVEGKHHITASLAPCKYHGFVGFADALPKTISGRLRRVEIHKNYMKKCRSNEVV